MADLFGELYGGVPTGAGGSTRRLNEAALVCCPSRENGLNVCYALRPSDFRVPQVGHGIRC
jgi:hypothetical protein